MAGLAPNRTFSTLVGTAEASLAAPVSWTNGLASPAADPAASTNDLFVYPSTGDAHLLARNPAGPALQLPATRWRFVRGRSSAHSPRHTRPAG